MNFGSGFNLYEIKCSTKKNNRESKRFKNLKEKNLYTYSFSFFNLIFPRV